MNFPINEIRKDFPILFQEVNKRPLVYFDNAATGQKPVQVIDAIQDYYKRYNSNVHRGVHHLSQLATEAMEQARDIVQKHLHAPTREQVLFTRGTTEAINLVAQCYGELIPEGKTLLVSELEHHSNIVPWQMLAQKRNLKLEVIPIDDAGCLRMDVYHQLLNKNVALVAVNHVSNALGTINPVVEIIQAAHSVGAVVMIDGAQSIPHMKIDVQALDADFYCFSGHKACAPTGIGILYGKKELLDAMPPYMGGGDMIKTVSFKGTTYAEIPFKYEAGTPNIEGAIGLGVALNYMNDIGLDEIYAYENSLLHYATEQLHALGDIRLYGIAESKASVISFIPEGTHPYDVGVLLDKMGVAVRTGHHCTQPIMERFEIPGTVRASFAFYNTVEEIDIFIEALKKACSMLR